MYNNCIKHIIYKFKTWKYILLLTTSKHLLLIRNHKSPYINLPHKSFFRKTSAETGIGLFGIYILWIKHPTTSNQKTKTVELPNGVRVTYIEVPEYDNLNNINNGKTNTRKPISIT